ncbi:D-alanine--D-alanine ligase family protein [Jonesia quinghaiensis]|uniref:D-alanine--D-alanine ligase family protein n=1 Tax=Jonesia quinghaiensis TaxID=262806 RepID=UPI0004052782|nr:D-alanine--D-alanine ligase [Jonesia quinghaiensis]
MTRRVVVIGGGESAEHDVSLGTAAAISDALTRLGFHVDDITINKNGVWTYRGKPLGETPRASVAGALTLFDTADTIFPAVHGVLGEDGTLAALCAITHTPMVGSTLGAGALAMDKWATKLIAEACGISTASGVCVTAAEAEELLFTRDVVVKPVMAGSSYGVTLVRDHHEFADAIRVAAQHDNRILVEEAIRGREIDVAVLRQADGTLVVAPPLEIHAAGLFDTAAKYGGNPPFTVPAVLTEREEQDLTNAARIMFNALGCRGVARIDFFLTDNGLVLNEVNTIPGMTPDSQVPRMFAAGGVDYTSFIAELVATAQSPAPISTADLVFHGE